MKRLMFIIALLCGILGVSAQNTLSVPNFQSAASKTVNVPVEMDNAADIVGVQFDIELPFDMPTGAEATLNSVRNTNGHSVALRSIGSRKYTVVVVNFANKPVTGNAGTLVNIPMKVSDTAEPSIDYPITVSKVVLTDRFGKNVATETSASGIFTIQRSASPDLEVGRVSCSSEAASPGQDVSFSWIVSNVGQLATGGGWSESIYLVSESTGQQAFVGKQYFNNTLVAGGYSQRNVTLKLPEVLGVDGNVKVKVELEPNSNTGEYLADRANNVAVSDGTLNVTKQLFLSSPVSVIEEGKSMRVTLKRSGRRDAAMTFAINCNNALLRVPATVTIPASEASVTFTVDCPENNTVDENVNAVISVASAFGYPAERLAVVIDDNDLLPISVDVDKRQYNEGETLHLTIGVTRRIGDDDLTVSLNIDQPKRFRLPQSFTFDKGSTLAEIDIPILQDNIPANDTEIVVRVSADRHQTGTASFTLIDDDTPAIDLQLTPDAVNEGGGANAIVGTVTRQGATGSKITLRLSDDGAGDLFYDKTVTMAEGVTEVSFPIGVCDNSVVDGDRTVYFTAEVFITDCNCSAIGDKQTSVTKAIQILDNDGPSLSVTSSKTTILEGDTNGATLTISRNTGTSAPLTVALTAVGSGLSYPATVVIPAGQTSASAVIYAVSNSTVEGNRTVNVSATCDGYSAGTAWLLISDNTLPDISVSNEALPIGTMSAGSQFTIDLPIKNIGAATMPSGAVVYVKLNGVTVKSVTVDTRIDVGETYNFDIPMDVIDVPGEYTLTVDVNADKKINELQYINNTASSTFTVAGIYNYTVTADALTYNVGNQAILSGKVTGINGASAANVPVEVYIVYSGSRKALNTTSDSKGNFSVSYTIAEGMVGDYAYGACVPAENLTTEMGEFCVYGVMRAETAPVKNYLYVGEVLDVTVKLKNPGGKALHNIRTEISDPSGHYTVDAPAISVIDGGAQADLEYTIVSQAVSSTEDWDQITLTLTCDEGAQLQIKTYNYSRTRSPKLTVTEPSINTSVNKTTPRNYPITLTNSGEGPTGIVSVSVPSAMSDLVSIVTPAQMPSMAQGDSTTVMLRFDGANYDLNLVQQGRIAINCENGNGLAVPFSVKVVSEDKGDLLVKVQDENTVYGTPAGEHPYVAGATVQLSDYNTGAIVASATTEADGTITFGNIAEGYYRLYVTAPKHDSYTQSVMVNPGTTTEHVATISYQAVTVDWTVEETTVEDEYEITPTVTYETHIPVPVLLISLPKTVAIAQLRASETLLFECQLTNKGLIPAQRVHITLPTIDGYTFQPLVDCTDMTISPSATATVPVLVTCTDPGSTLGENAPCNFRVDARYQWPCADLTKYNTISDVTSTGQTEGRCVGNSSAWTQTTGTQGTMGDEYIGTPGIGGTGSVTTTGTTTNVTYNKPVTCKTVDQIDGSTQTVCAYVKLSFDTKLVLTRQAFRGTLTIENNSGSPLTDISVAVTATAPDGAVATNREMQISIESISGFTGDKDDVWSLADGRTGVATILFVPTKYAAPETPTTYSFGGTLYFNDGAGLQSRGLYPVELVVKPSPQLDVTYFLQRDIYGDNPLTEYIVEPVIPAEFTALIYNKGYGDATDVRMLMGKPRIVENENGLDIDFSIVSSSLNGKDQALALEDNITTEFGSIPAHTGAYVTWGLISTYLGHFVDYDISYTHVNSKGNTDLSLLDRVNIRGLIHSVNANLGTAVYRGWVTDDIEDDEDMPDHIYLADGTDAEVDALVDATVIEELSAGNYRVSLTAARPGWLYTKVTNPEGGDCEIISVINEDTGIAIDPDNTWLTDYTMPDSRVPVKEYKLHLVDYVTSAGEKHYRIKLGKKAIDNRIPCGGITLTFADTNSDDGDAYAFEVGTSRRVTVTAKPADCYFDPSMLVFSLPNTADAPTSWNLVSVSNASVSGNKYICDLTLNCPVDMSMLTVTYYGYTDPTLASGRVQCVTPVKAGVTYTAPRGWSWIGVPTVDGPNVEEFFGDKLIEVRTSTKYVVNDPDWGYFGNTEAEISVTTDNGHFRANLSDELTTRLYGSTSFNPAWTQIKPGFNWVANPMFFDLDLNDYPDFWQNLADEDMIKGKDGFGAYYDATTGQWDGWLETLEAGSAYMLNTSSQIKRIDFPCSSVNTPKLSAPRARSVRAVAADEPIWQYDGSAFQCNMAIAAVVEGLDQPEEFSIGTFVGDECRGEGNYKKGVWYIFAHGEPGDIVTLKLMHVPTRTLYDFDCELEFFEAIGTPKNPLVLYAPDGVNDTSAIDTIEIDGTPLVNAKAIYDINGRDVTAANGHLLPGIYIARTATGTVKVVVK